jgi:hypothetical protein
MLNKRIHFEGVPMKRTRFDSLVTEKTLRIINGTDSVSLLDLAMSDSDNQEHVQTITKNVCAKLSTQLSDKIDSVTGFLSISKRAFIEAALIQAIEQAEEIMEREGLFEHLSQDEEQEAGK